MAKISKDTWVQIYKVILEPGERAPNLPPETEAVPFEMRVKGFLLEDAEMGGEARIRTVIGREIQGTLVEANPRYPHNFGAPVPELLPIGGEIRAMFKGEALLSKIAFKKIGPSFDLW